MRILVNEIFALMNKLFEKQYPVLGKDKGRVKKKCGIFHTLTGGGGLIG